LAAILLTERSVANQKGLRLVGWAYGGLALMVAVTAFVVVSAQINGQVQARTGDETKFARLPN
jgi:hypothetical protein